MSSCDNTRNTIVTSGGTEHRKYEYYAATSVINFTPMVNCQIKRRYCSITIRNKQLFSFHYLYQDISTVMYYYYTSQVSILPIMICMCFVTHAFTVLAGFFFCQLCLGVLYFCQFKFGIIICIPAYAPIVGHLLSRAIFLFTIRNLSVFPITFAFQHFGVVFPFISFVVSEEYGPPPLLGKSSPSLPIFLDLS